MLGPTPAGKKVWQRLQGHALPLRNLDGMDPIVCGKLIDRPFPTDRLESHFRLERTTVLPSLCRHLLVLPHGSMSLTYSVVQFLGSIITLVVCLSRSYRLAYNDYTLFPIMSIVSFACIYREGARHNSTEQLFCWSPRRINTSPTIRGPRYRVLCKSSWPAP